MLTTTQSLLLLLTGLSLLVGVSRASDDRYDYWDNLQQIEHLLELETLPGKYTPFGDFWERCKKYRWCDTPSDYVRDYDYPDLLTNPTLAVDYNLARSYTPDKSRRTETVSQSYTPDKSRHTGTVAQSYTPDKSRRTETVAQSYTPDKSSRTSKSCKACGNTGKVCCSKDQCIKGSNFWFGGHIHNCMKFCNSCDHAFEKMFEPKRTCTKKCCKHKCKKCGAAIMKCVKIVGCPCLFVAGAAVCVGGCCNPDKPCDKETVEAGCALMCMACEMCDEE